MRGAEASLSSLWERSRSGAWAGRGFHVQHLFSVLVLVRQWAGLAPAGALVPEGLDDSVIEFADHSIWIQVKSRREGSFSASEVEDFLAEIDAKAAQIDDGKEIRTAVALEQPRSGANEDGVDRLFEDCKSKIVVCSAPENEIVRLLVSRLRTAEVIAEGILSDLYRLVADTSQANASLSFDQRRRISTTEVERRISERLEAADPSAIDGAIASRVLEPVDFNTPVREPGFYQGVKVRPGHVAAGLVMKRRDEMKNVVEALRQRRHVLISGPSGAGKSALMWLSAHELAGELRWFQVATKAVAADADAVIRFVRSRRPTETSPIGLVFDDVGSSNSDLWDVLVRELRSLPAVCFLGSVRQEDMSLIANQSDTEFVRASLDEKLAQTIWERLSADNRTNWAHWREPFEQSEGLTLEYVHLLTQGKRLGAVIDEQIRQREREDRNDELAIIRSTAVLCARGGEVEVGKLCELLNLTPDRAGLALKRLIDEHLVRESRPGVLGGLHALRSEALEDASHDEIVFLRAKSLWNSIGAATSDTLPRVIQSVLAQTHDDAEGVALQKLAGILGASNDSEVWATILTGLGLATLERGVASLMAILEQHNVQRSQWSLASMFVDASVDIPELSQAEQWRRLRDAVLAFRAAPKHDLRRGCLELLPEGSAGPACDTVQQANRLLSSLAPIFGSHPLRMPLRFTFSEGGEQDIREVAALLATAYLLGRDIAERLVETLGGEEALFGWYRSQTPWVTTPVIEEDGRHGRTVRSNWLHVAERWQPDPHQTVCDICETLIAISPRSDAAASDSVNPQGQAISVGEFTPWSKNMPRKNIPAKTRVAWNVAFRQIFLARSAADSLTAYTGQMGLLVRRTEKVFRSFTEKWVKGKALSNAAEVTAEINRILNAVDALAYASPGKPPPAMTAPNNAGRAEDTLGELLTSILGNLLKRVSEIQGKEGAKAAAVFAGGLADQAREHAQSAIWRTSASPPLKELTALSDRLADTACVLHELAYEDQAAIPGIVKSARKGTLGKAVHAGARRCRSVADERFHARLQELEQALHQAGWKASCYSRPVEQRDSVYWPAREAAILVEIDDFETDARYIEEGLAIGRQYLGDEWRFRVVPVMNGSVLASLAVLSSSNGVLPDHEFAQEWQAHIDRRFLLAETAVRFEEAIAACVQVSAVVACRDLEKLHREEEEVLSKAIESFNQNRQQVATTAAATGSEHFAWALDYLDQIWNEVIAEFEAARSGEPVERPFCTDAYLATAGRESARTGELAAARVLLLQAECRSWTAGAALTSKDSSAAG